MTLLPREHAAEHAPASADAPVLRTALPPPVEQVPAAT